MTTVFNDKTEPDGYPAYAPLADSWLATLAKDPFFAFRPTAALKGSRAP